MPDDTKVKLNITD